jgi:hypothetical protein
MKILEVFDSMCGPLCGGSSAYAVDDDADDDVVDSSKKMVTVAPKVPRGKYANDKETNYECFLFAALSSDAKEAVIALGFDEESWNESGWPASSESKCWGDLTEEERKAVETLGWDSVAWDSTHESSSFFVDLPPFVGKTYKKLFRRGAQHEQNSV